MKVLVINNLLIGEENATGATLKNIFSGFSDIDILEYTFVPDSSREYSFNGTHIETICNQKTNYLNKFIHNYHQKSLKSNTGFSDETNVSWKSKLKLKLKKDALMWNELIPIKIEKECMQQIINFSPELIYTLGADINVLRNVIKLSELLNIPIVLHNMDDLYHTKFNGHSFFQKLAKRKLQKLYKKAYEHSKKSLAIGPKMAKEYEELFGLPFDWAMNCVGDIQSEVAPEENLAIFSGGLHGGRATTLASLAQALEGTAIKLEIYTDDRNFVSYESLFAGLKNTRLCHYVPNEKMFDNLSRASILVHVESFEEEYIKYFRLSMSTKIPEYLVAKRPVFCIGPKEIATSSYIENSGVGVVAESYEDISDKLTQLTSADKKEEILCCIETRINEDFRRADVQKKICAVFEYNVM
ncbi:MAG: hypothetical protein IJW76_01480 [Clostridia bacterium]|nr:hypothetical protein [Clostridia bacterium]